MSFDTMKYASHTDCKLPQSAATFYRTDIDGLRAVAVLLVLIFHFQLVPLGKAGFIGVDIFFVISGYLITENVTRQLQVGTFSIKRFYLARLRRLAPALIFVLSAATLWGVFRLMPTELEELGRQIAAAQFYVSNIYFWRNYNYFGLGSGSVYMLHMWSLAVEEQFYLIYPLLLLVIHRWAPRAFGVILFTLAAGSFLLNVTWVVPKAMNTFYLLPTRSWELLAGALLAVVRLGSPKRILAEGVGLVSWALILVAVFCYHPGIPIPGWFVLMPVVAALGFLFSGKDPRTITHKLLSWAAMRYIGNISYVLYLVHWPINVFAKHELGDAYDYKWRLAMFGISVLLADLVWRWVERPVREGRILPNERSILPAYIVALVITGIVSTSLIQSGGWPGRLPPEAVRLESFVRDRTPPLTECSWSDKFTLPPPVTCKIGAADKEPSWLVMGDSHAWAGHAMFSEWLRRRGEAGWLIFRHACPPLAGIKLAGDQSQGCFNFNRATYSWMDQTPSLMNVMLVSTWLQASEGILVQDPSDRPHRSKSLELFATHFEDSVRLLKRSSKVVWIWGPVPGARASVPPELALAAWRSTSTDLEVTLAEHEARFLFFSEAVEKAMPVLSGYIDPAKTLCKTGRCAVAIEGQPLYFDNAHMAASSATRWVSFMEEAEVHIELAPGLRPR